MAFATFENPPLDPTRPVKTAAGHADPARAGPTIEPVDFASHVTIAVDTEFRGKKTLLVQAATRLDARTVVVQLYRSRSIPELPPGFDAAAFFAAPAYEKFLGRVIVLPTRPITPRLSPVRMLRDLLGHRLLTPLDRHRGRDLVRGLAPDSADLPANVAFDRRTGVCRVPSTLLTIVGHFLTADFYRFTGREFLGRALAAPADPKHRLEVRAGRLLSFHEPRRSNKPGAVLEYAQLDDGRLFEVRVAMRDTGLPFGKGSLDAHSSTFLGVPKSDALTVPDKEDMRRTFGAKAVDAYGYAVVDAVNTLLIHEEMQRRDREIYRSFGFPDGSIPPLRATLGGRVQDFLVKATLRHAEGSAGLSSAARLRGLMREGGLGLFENHPGASRFGRQTGEVHGGLLFSRTPTRFWHEAPGQLRDVDMASCYAGIAAGIDVYWGRPLIVEPGSKAMRLKDAVGFLKDKAPGDGWMIRVSGPIKAGPNALIPSTEGALTSENYKVRRRRGGEATGGAHKGGSRLYTATIRAGVVTLATWMLIRALPRALRLDYEGLRVECIAFYPSKLIAADGPSFDGLVARHADRDLPWEASLDLRGMKLVKAEAIGTDYVSLRFPIGDHARKLGELRREARRSEGKGGVELALKQEANAMYGVLACPRMDTGNFVAANVITARARAEAFALVQSLNGFQVITDGCTYRRDQVPSCTLAECLRVDPDYPIRRAEADAGIPFHDPRDIPDDDAGFTQWYRGHVRAFFGRGVATLGVLVDTHELEHKRAGSVDSAAFDALATDGCGNSLKASVDPAGGWIVEDFSARSYGKASKSAIKGWMVDAYASDDLEGLAPLAEDRILLKHDEAMRKADQALGTGLTAVYVPLGLESRRVANYRAIKASSFLFRIPEQRRAIVRQIDGFERRTGCGLELPALRRTYQGRRKGSLVSLASEIDAAIRAGETDLVKRLNANRLSPELREISAGRLAELAHRRRQAQDALLREIDLGRSSPPTIATGRILTADGGSKAPR